jgi:uncharacterized protein
MPGALAEDASRVKLAAAAAWGLSGAALVIGFVVAVIGSRQQLSFEPSQITLPADGAEHKALRIHVPASWPGFKSSVTQDADAAPRLRLLQTGDPGGAVWEGMLLSPVNPGSVQLYLHWRGHLVQISATFVFDSSDSYGDGTPDFLRLHSTQDRQTFRQWFISIAEAQADRSPLPAEIDDCAALLRFAYREALRTHDENWLRAYPGEAGLPSVRQYSYPRTPLGANLFRTRAGPFDSADPGNGSFAQFADARSLMEYNTYLIGRDLRLARPGDLIFYRQLDQDSPYDVAGASHTHSPFHSMIFCGEQGVVYHTGPIRQGKGEMRRLPVSDLLHYPDVRWRPVPENTNFLGVYRWNILREGD